MSCYYAKYAYCMLIIMRLLHAYCILIIMRLLHAHGIDRMYVNKPHACPMLGVACWCVLAKQFFSPLWKYIL
jgi:hypothetical protein